MKEEFRTPPDISFEPEPGPGARLRQAREAANRGIGEISAALHLDPKKVEALEADSFDLLPPPAFVRGYLKGYARLLGLPPGPILEVYDRRGFEPPPLVPDVTEAPQVDTSDLAVRLVTWGIGVMLVVLVALWWHSQDFEGFDILDAGRDLIGWSSGSTPASPDGGEGHDGSTAAGASPGTREGAGSAGGTEPSGSPAAGGAADGATAAAEPRPSSAPAESTVAESTATESTAAAEAPPDDGSTSGAASAVGMVATEETVAVEPPPDGDSSPEGGAGAGGGPTIEAPSPPSESGRVTAESSPPSDEDGVAGGVAATEPPPSPTPADTAAGGMATTGPTPSVDGGVPAAGASAVAGATPTPGIAAVPGAGSVIADREETPAPEEAGGVPLVVPVGPSIPAAGSSLLVIEFTNESWVEIYDGHGATLFFDLVPPDRVLQVTGAPPFDVLFGNSRDVRVTFDGEPFDHAPHVNRGVARFSLGAAPEGGPDPVAGAVPPSPDERRLETPSDEAPRPGF